jgi:hypothetical protein
MRGHRLSLVWLGYRLGELRQIRGDAVGTESQGRETKVLRSVVPEHPTLPTRQHAILDRYGMDMLATMQQLAQTLRPGGRAVLVVGDCTVRGTFVCNSDIVAAAGREAGLSLCDRRSRELPSQSRYLPPPNSTSGAMAARMREETVLVFDKN